MSNTIPNRQVICQVLLDRAKMDKTITVLCSDSRGSASLAPFAKEFPEQFVEMGIAEQSLVSTAAGMARCGLRPFAASPASFLSTRSMEQVKVDVAYSHTNVKLIGISGGISYGALGMTHHSAQDIAALASIPGLRVYLPSDRFLTQALLEVLVEDNDPAYIRVGRNAVEDVYDSVPESFQMDKALTVREGRDVTLIACGELVRPALDAALLRGHRGGGVQQGDFSSRAQEPFPARHGGGAAPEKERGLEAGGGNAARPAWDKINQAGGVSYASGTLGRIGNHGKGPRGGQPLCGADI